jgi:transketolase
VRVVSMPSWELFREQSQAYRDEVLPPAIKLRLGVEAAAPEGWHEWVGEKGEIISMTQFGASAPYKELFKYYGFTVENIVEKVNKMIAGKS